MRRWRPIHRAVYRLRFHWQGWRIRRRGDYDLGVNDAYGRMYLTRGQAESLRKHIAEMRAKKELE